MKNLILTFLFALILTSSFAQLYPDLEVFCADIESEVDDDTEETVYFSPYDKPIYFKKRMGDGGATYTMTINLIGPAPNTGKGVVVYLGRNYTITKNDALTEMYQNADGQYVHYATIPLSNQDISMLKNYLISSYDVYMYSGGEDDNNVNYQGYIYCLDKK
jgi:hypothetical protein